MMACLRAHCRAGAQRGGAPSTPGPGLPLSGDEGRAPELDPQLTPALIVLSSGASLEGLPGGQARVSGRTQQRGAQDWPENGQKWAKSCGLRTGKNGQKAAWPQVSALGLWAQGRAGTGKMGVRLFPHVPPGSRTPRPASRAGHTAPAPQHGQGAEAGTGDTRGPSGGGRASQVGDEKPDVQRHWATRRNDLEQTQPSTLETHTPDPSRALGTRDAGGARAWLTTRAQHGHSSAIGGGCRQQRLPRVPKSRKTGLWTDQRTKRKNACRPRASQTTEQEAENVPGTCRTQTAAGVQPGVGSSSPQGQVREPGPQPHV